MQLCYTYTEVTTHCKTPPLSKCQKDKKMKDLTNSNIDRQKYTK